MTRYPYSFDRVAEVFDVTRAVPPAAMDRIVATIAGVVGDDRVLEVGVGTGRLSLPLQRAGVRAIGADVSRAMLRVGVGKGLEDVVLGDIHRLPFPDRSFGVSMTTHVLHFLKEWKVALREVVRVTGRSYLSVFEKGTSVPDLDAEYTRFIEENGTTTRRPGLRERELSERLPPNRRFAIGVFVKEETAAEYIDLLDRRVYSSQWNIPEAVHRSAIDRLRVDYAGRTVHDETRIDIGVWDVAGLDRFLAAPDPTP